MPIFPAPPKPLFPTQSTLFPAAAPQDQAIQFGLGVSDPLEQSVQGFPQSYLGQVMAQRQQEMLARAGLPADADPNTMTPDEMGERLDTAIAKVALVNPELAKQMQESRQSLGKVDRGLFGDIWGSVSEGFLKTFEFLTRPARVIPSLIMDKGEDPLGSIGDALVGKSHHIWADALGEMGVRNDAVRSILGFALDVGTDPLTYIGFGALGRGRILVGRSATTALFGTKVSGEQAVGILKQLSAHPAGAAKGVQAVDDVAKAQSALLTTLTKSGMNPDAAGGGLVNILRGADRELTLAGLRLAEDAGAQLHRVGFKNLPATISDRTGQYSIAKGDLFKALEHMRKTGTYSQRAGAAGALGGIRFRVPWMRWVSPDVVSFLTGGKLVSFGFGFQPLRRFVAGDHGLTRIARAISKDGPITMDDFQRWTTSTPRKPGDLVLNDVVAANPAIKELMGGPGNMGSMLWRASDRLGRMTGGFLNHQLAYRHGGLTAIMTHDFNVQYKTWRRRLLDETALTHRNADGDMLKNPAQVRAELAEVLEKNGLASLDDHVRQSRFLDLVPSRRAAMDPDAWWQENVFGSLEDKFQRGQLSADDFKGAMDEGKHRLETFKSSIDDVKKSGEFDTLVMVRELQDQMHEHGTSWGAMLRNTAADFDNAVMLRRRQMSGWNGGTALAGETYRLQAVMGDEPLRWMPEGVGLQDVHSGSRFGLDGAGEGVHLTAVGDGPHVQVKLNRVLEGDGQWAEWRKEMEPVIKAEYQDQLTRGHLTADFDEILDTALTHRAIRGGYDGRRFVDANGATRVVVFPDANTADDAIQYLGSSRVKIQNSVAPLVTHGRGYTPRAFADQLVDFVGRRHAPKDVPVVVTNLQHTLTRKFDDLPFDEAAEEVRKVLRKDGYAVPDDMPIFEPSPTKAYFKYSNNVADAVLGEVGGQQLWRLEQLGFPGMGSVVGETTYRYPEFIKPRHLARLDKEVQEYYVKGRRALEKAERGRIKAAMSINNRLLQFRRLLDEKSFKALEATEPATDLRQALINADARSRALKAELQRAKKVPGARTADEIQADVAALKEELNTLRTQSRRGAGGLKRGQQFKPLAELSAEELEKVEDVLRAGQNSLDEHSKLKAAYYMDLAEPKVAFAPDHPPKSGYSEVRLPGQKRSFWAHPYIAEEMDTLMQRFSNINAFRHWYRSHIMSRWKTWATVMNPGFHFRNNYGAMFNNLLGGMDHNDFVVGLRLSRVSAEINKSKVGKWSRRPVEPRYVKRYNLAHHFSQGHEITYKDFWSLADGDQVGSAGARGFEASRVDPFISRAAGDTAAIPGVTTARRTAVGRQTLDRWQHLMEGAMVKTENLHRYSGYVTGLRQHGGDRGAARLWTMLRHGDYVDLNDWEMGLVRDLLPFYKWMRTNLPYQIHQLLEVPGKHLSVLKLKDAMIELQGLDREELNRSLPGWLKEEFFIPLPDWMTGDDALGLMTLDLPMNDLGMGVNEFFSAFLPTVRPFIESGITETTFFTGKKLTGKMNPMPEWMRPMGWMLENLGFAARNTEGQYTISDKFENVVSVLPLYSRYRNWMTAEPSRVNQRMQTFASAVFGVGFRNVTEETLTRTEQEFFFREIEPTLIQLRSLGVQFPDKDEIAPEVFTFLGMEAPEEE